MQENIGLFLAKRAELTPRHEGFVQVETGLRLTWAELNARANRIANALLALGVRPGDRVALLLMNGPEMFESYAAIAKLGAIAVPLNWRLVPDELSVLLLDSGAVCLIFADGFDAQAAELSRRGAAGSSVKHWLRVGDDAALPGFARSYARAQAEASAAEPPVGASGTGRPADPVHLGHHRPSEGGGAHAPHGDLGRDELRRLARHALPRRLAALHAGLPRRRAEPVHLVRTARHQAGGHARVRPHGRVARDRGRARQLLHRGAGDAQRDAAAGRARRGRRVERALDPDRRLAGSGAAARGVCDATTSRSSEPTG